MSQLLIWTIGSILATVFVVITVIVAWAGYRWAKQEGDPRLIRTARHALIGCLGGLASATVMLLAAVIAYTGLVRGVVVWLLLTLPWIAVFRNGREVWHIWKLRTERQEAKEEGIREDARAEGNAEGRAEQKAETDAEAPTKVEIVQNTPVDVHVIEPEKESP